MKAVIAMCLTEMISARFGKNKLKIILDEANIPSTERNFLPTFDTPDKNIMAIYTATCKVMDLSANIVGDLFGDYWCKNYIKNLYEAYFKSATGAKDFLLKMKRIHNVVTEKIPNAKPPDFDYVDEMPDKLIMKYYSDRNLQPIWLGCIKGVGLIYNETVDIVRLDDNTVEITFKKEE